MNARVETFLNQFPKSCVIAFAGLLFFLSSCSVGPNYSKPEAPVSPAYKEEGSDASQGPQWKEAKPSDGEIRGQWWEIYNDTQLNALEEQVDISNQNVLAAEAQFRAARAAVKIARAGAYPTLNASPSITKSRSSSTLVTVPPAPSSTAGTAGRFNGVQTDYNLQAEISYIPDIWGNIRRTVEQSSTSAQASFADLENARLSYHALLAQDYFGLRGLDGQKQLLETTVESYQKFIKLTNDRYQSGIASRADVAQAEAQLDTARAQLIDVGIQRAQFEHAIAILIGTPPSQFSIPSAPFTGTPPSIPVGVPSDLLERRPDIAGAERRMAAANAGIGVAIAAYFPTLTLTATAGVESFQLTQLLSEPSTFWSLGASVAQNIFDAGKRHAQVEQARASYQATVANYRQTVLTSFQQVEDNLAALRLLEEEALVQNAAVKAAEQSLTVSTAQYKEGIQSYLQVIVAQTTALSDELNAVNILTRRMTSSVLLIEALGGGWDVSKLPTTHDVSILPSKETEPSKGSKDEK